MEDVKNDREELAALFKNGDRHIEDLIRALDDPDRDISIRAQIVIRYLGNDLVKEVNQSSEDAEKNAESFADQVDDEKNTTSEADAEKRVREILDLPPKQVKKKNNE